MLQESIQVYDLLLQPIILEYARAPKANYMSSPGLVRYFDDLAGNKLIYVESLEAGATFFYRGKRYRLEQRLKKNYLCQETDGGRKYLFKPLAKVERI